MVQVGGRPILEHNVCLLKRHGIKELVINLHHCPQAVIDYFGSGSRWGISITYSYEPELLGTAGSIRNWAQFFTEPFFVIYGDNLTTCDLGSMFRFHGSKGGIGTIALYHREDVTASGIAELDSTDRITRFLEKPHLEEIFSHWVYAGLMVLDPLVFGYIPPNRPSDFGRDVLPVLIDRGLALFGYRMSEKLWWIDSLADYEGIKSMQPREFGPI
jgi:NDP-sugar pyrophosphorylase family protein